MPMAPSTSPLWKNRTSFQSLSKGITIAGVPFDGCILLFTRHATGALALGYRRATGLCRLAFQVCFHPVEQVHRFCCIGPDPTVMDALDRDGV